MRVWLQIGALASAPAMAIFVGAGPARAETPVDQCTDSGSGPGGMPTVGTGLQPESNFVTRPATSAQIGLGTVNPRNGAFVYSNEDISLGAGEFPARLNLVRTYSSDQDGPLGTEVMPFAPYMPGSRQWFYFGRGATHNLDIRFEIGRQSFNGQVYQMVNIRTGFQTETFQVCLNGQYKNSRANGSRLFADATYGTGGFRYEMPDGTTVLFQKLAVTGSYVFSCGRAYSSSVVCGAARRWQAPNGDWAEFEYQTYYSHPTNRADIGSVGGSTITNWIYNAGVTECHPNFAGQSECRSVAFPTYYTTLNAYYATPSYPVYEQRLMRVSNSRGYELRFAYVDSTVNSGGTCSVSDGTSLYCSPATNTTMARNRIQSIIGNWVSPAGQTTAIGQVIYGYSGCSNGVADCLSSIQAPDGATTLISRLNSDFAIQLPGETTPSTTVAFTSAPHSYYYPDRLRGYYTYNPRLTRNYFRVSTRAFADGSSVSYNVTFADRWVPEPYGMWARQPYAATMQITESGGAVTTLNYVDQYDEHSGPVTVTDPLLRVTTNTYDAVGGLASTTKPGGQRTDYSYDVRGNLLSTTRHPAPGSVLAPLIDRTTYTGGPTLDANACANQRLCNRPISRTDARDAQTDYDWEATGLLTSETLPPDPSGQRPQTSYSYGTFTGANSSAIQLVVSRTERIDATQNVVTNYGYGANIRLPLREMSRSDGTTTLRSCYGFDLIGNPISLTEPNAALPSCP